MMKCFKKLAACIAVLCMAAIVLPSSADAARIKDIADFGGVRDNQLVGYGLVTGLGGSGDSSSSTFTVRSVVNMLEKMGVSVNASDIKSKNIAAVMVTAKLPVSAKPGSRLDVTVSSIGDAKSLLGGVLLMTPLKGVDGQVYGLAQGPVAIGGFSAEGKAAKIQKNITTVGRIPNGMNVERAVPFEFNSQNTLTLNMHNGDFSTTNQVVERLNQAIGGNFAFARDISTITLDVPPQYRNNIVPLMAAVENIEIRPDTRAKVVVDENTGTVVVGSNVRISPVAIAHGSLQIVVQEDEKVSQPNPFSEGETVTTPQTNVGIKEENKRLVLLEGATLQDLTEGLNAIGATPRDLISILNALKAAGALHADLEVI
ncbi:MAG: flagellar basal body P-ring protein FlgI [Desulfovibrionales bacterium]|nr:flagellar basal body P-ring protein FlgI [Desulfovibrionales bacterium]